MDVSIIIVNYNTRVLVQNSIESIISKTKDIEYEIIVVDNASVDDSLDIFPNDSRIKYIYNRNNLGFGLANNVGIEIAKGRNVFLLNPDTLLLNNSIKILSDFLDDNPKVGCCGGNLFDENMQPVHSYSMLLPSFMWEMNLLFAHKIEYLIWGKNAQFNYTANPRKVGYICGADMMLRRSVLDQVGCFSDRFFLYYEDTELSYRIKHAGYEIISVPKAKIQHLVGKSMGGKEFNPSRVKFVESGLSSFYSLHTKGIKRFIIQCMRLLRLNLKFVIYRKRFGYDLYIDCKKIINRQERRVDF